MSALYFGTSAVSPTSSNYNGYQTLTYAASSCGYTVSLTAGNYYPLILYWGQSTGGAGFGLGYIKPGSSSVTYDGTGKFFNLNDNVQQFSVPFSTRKLTSSSCYY